MILHEVILQVMSLLERFYKLDIGGPTCLMIASPMLDNVMHVKELVKAQTRQQYHYTLF